MGTPLAGKGGDIKVDTAGGGSTTTIAEIKSWSLDVSVDMLDTTDFASTGDWREFLDGLKGWTGSCEGQFDYTDTTGQKLIIDSLLTPAKLDFRFMVNSTSYFYGAAYAQATSVTTPVDGIVGVTFNLQGTGALAVV